MITLTLSEPAMLGTGGIVLHQVLKKDKTIILDTIRVSPSLLTMHINNQEIMVEARRLNLVPNAVYMVGEEERGDHG